MYQYKDHLGNNRVSYAVDPADNVLKIKEENHYYPFGLKHWNYNNAEYSFQGRNAGVILMSKPPGGGGDPFPTNPFVKANYNYKYNGKEWQDELGLNMYDYGARNYDPAIGRWMNIDPLAEVSRRWSPYSYCYNNPIFFVDPDGMTAMDTKDDHPEHRTFMKNVLDNVAKVVGAATGEGDWIPNADGSVTAEANDDKCTYAEAFGVSVEEAEKALTEGGAVVVLECHI